MEAEKGRIRPCLPHGFLSGRPGHRLHGAKLLPGSGFEYDLRPNLHEQQLLQLPVQKEDRPESD